MQCEGDGADSLFREAAGDPAGERWPFEWALLSLEFGEWLRRKRRMGEARNELAHAMTVFERLGAWPWTDRAAGELRACGVAVRSVESPEGVSRLTPQQLQIARLATGLTNRQIGERLLVSAQTVDFIYTRHVRSWVSELTPDSWSS